MKQLALIILLLANSIQASSQVNMSLGYERSTPIGATADKLGGNLHNGVWNFGYEFSSAPIGVYVQLPFYYNTYAEKELRMPNSQGVLGAADVSFRNTKYTWEIGLTYRFIDLNWLRFSALLAADNTTYKTWYEIHDPYAPDSCMIDRDLLAKSNTWGITTGLVADVVLARIATEPFLSLSIATKYRRDGSTPYSNCESGAGDDHFLYGMDPETGQYELYSGENLRECAYTDPTGIFTLEFMLKLRFVPCPDCFSGSGGSYDWDDDDDDWDWGDDDNDSSSGGGGCGG